MLRYELYVEPYDTSLYQRAGSNGTLDLLSSVHAEFGPQDNEIHAQNVHSAQVEGLVGCTHGSKLTNLSKRDFLS